MAATLYTVHISRPDIFQGNNVKRVPLGPYDIYVKERKIKVKNIESSLQRTAGVQLQIILANPKITALPLLVGVPTIQGPGQSVTEISPILLNQDHIKAECFIRQFAEFQSGHPGFVVHSMIGLVTVIVMQTQYIVSNLAVNGIATDAANGYWQDHKVLLLISSVYGFT
ncbi:hypothetical protein FIBSPDRAFT_900290 [Athelia psychrophila]|uniref:Uncharacterized protein n=1 Tax=Athelia psychrophila TaxID=1759441 RepID=A0A165YLD6_9AGAM|nr:hypothetical protein FIBSPDRAFT_900290 [Fibularhizoctonia sp. CBS 109695]